MSQTNQRSQILQNFAYFHLPPHLQNVSKLFWELAWRLERDIPNSAEKTVALRKLMESKDCAVRSVLPENVWEIIITDRLSVPGSEIVTRMRDVNPHQPVWALTQDYLKSIDEKYGMTRDFCRYSFINFDGESEEMPVNVPLISQGVKDGSCLHLVSRE